jgi:hypothetical protein
MLVAAALFACFQAAAQPDIPAILSRLAEESEILQQNAPKALTQETLEQRTLMPATRFRPRIGSSAIGIPAPRLVVRQIVSEYSVGTLKDSASHDLTELRQVISVDGRKVQSVESARHALSLGIKSPDDRIRKRMLEEFAKHGLVDIATDYGIFLLAFNKRAQANLKVSVSGEEQVGPDPAWVLDWQQTSDDGGVLEFIGNQAAHRKLSGRVLVRKSDLLPLRIQAWSQHSQPGGHRIRDDATVDYVQSVHGFLTPASVVHRHQVDGAVITENLYRYEPFKLFSADAEIKFTELDSTPDTAKAPPAKTPVKK